MHACPDLGSRIAADAKAALTCLENWLHVAQSNVLCGPSAVEVGASDALCSTSVQLVY